MRRRTGNAQDRRARRQQEQRQEQKQRALAWAYQTMEAANRIGPEINRVQKARARKEAEGRKW